MKKFTILFLLLGFMGFAQVTTVPSPALADQPVTIYFNKAGTPLASYNGTIYAHTGLTVNGTQWSNVIGSWGSDTTQPALTLDSGTTYKLVIPSNLYTFYGAAAGSTITQICVVFRAAGPSGAPQSVDYFINVGAFQVNQTAPLVDSTTILNSGGNLNITANNTGGPANYNLMSNGVSINTANNVSTYAYNHTNITANQNYELVVTQGTNVITKDFSVIVNPNTANETLPAGMRDGINYNAGDATKATLVLNAPGKDFVYVAGSFNNWHPSSAYAMKKDAATGKFWVELTGLTSGQVNTFQYWVVDQTPVANSPVLVKVADPFSTLVLSPDDDPYITATTYPGLPLYPAGQRFDVSVLQTAQPSYPWQVTNFAKPAKEDLIIYELLVRDFTQEKTWDALSAKIDYFKNLHINAIEVMPIMEFEGNISWGYNTTFHMANDKAYGTADSMKAFIDLCHENGIAVILDVALNHVYGRSPLARMWVNDADGDGYGNTTTENPYCNVVATHAYSVGTDLNHQSALTQYYVQRTIEHWITDFHIDGFRWDLTKGFTQNCTGNEGCTNNYQADRVAILKTYADMQWAIDPNFYVIFEHMGTGSGSGSSAGEETEWANYRVNEGKGIMPWGKMTDPYNQNTMGFAGSSNFNSMDFENRGYSQPRLVGFAESHDEERLMYKNLQYGGNSGSYNVQNLATALNRMKALGSVFLTVPGPKMIWEFGELGYDFSINRCENGTTSDGCRTNPKPIAFELGYDTNADRMSLYNTWAKMLKLRKENAVFHTNTFTIASGNLLPRLDIWNDAMTTAQLKNVIVLANFNLTAQSVNTNFPFAGTWYNLMDNTTFDGSITSITLQPGEFRIFGNQAATVLGTDTFTAEKIALYPNPAKNQFSLSTAAEKVEVYAITGQLVKSFGAAEANTSFDVSSLGNGMYMVKVTDAANRQSTMKLVKE